MDWLEFFSSIINSLAWPVSIVIIILTLKTPIKSILAKVNKISFGGNEISISNDIPPSISDPDVALQSDQVTASENDNLNNFDNLARQRPDLAIIESFRRLEYSIREKYTTEYPDKSLTSNKLSQAQPLSFIVKKLKVDGLIDTVFLDNFIHLSRIRNKIIHNDYSDIEYSDAALYNQRASELIKALDSLSNPD